MGEPDRTRRSRLRVRALGRDLLGGCDADDSTSTGTAGTGTAGAETAGARTTTDVVVVPVFMDERPLLGMAGYLDWRLCGKLSQILRRGLCTARAGEQVLTCGFASVPFRRLVLLGMGHSGRLDREHAQAAGAQVVDLGNGLEAESVVVAVPSAMVSRELCESFGLALGQHLACRRPFDAAVATVGGARPTGRGAFMTSWPCSILVPGEWVPRFFRLLNGPPRRAED
ncbi:MAG: M17 family peptidase N-terminal domain-containing protein [Nannocystaceae bacterium]